MAPLLNAPIKDEDLNSLSNAIHCIIEVRKMYLDFGYVWFGNN